MPSRKNRPVLYEVVSRSKRPRAHSEAHRVTPTTSQPSSAPPAAPPTPTPHEKSHTPVARPTVRVAQGRLILSVGWPQALVIIGLVAVVLIATFQAGVRSTQPRAEAPADGDFLGLPTDDDANETPARPPLPDHRPDNGGILTPVSGDTDDSPAPTRPEPAEPPPPREEAFSFTPGSHYVVIQYFPRRAREAATAARDHLQSQGIDCRIRQRQRDLMLFATQPFSSANETQPLLARIRELGKEYFKTGSGYSFGDCLSQRF